MCCEPRLIQYPSGLHWTHSRFCAVVSCRNQRVRQHDLTPELDARLRHPAGADFAPVNPVAIWRSHPHGCLCEACGYVDHHLDRDDDRELVR